MHLDCYFALTVLACNNINAWASGGQLVFSALLALSVGVIATRLKCKDIDSYGRWVLLSSATLLAITHALEGLSHVQSTVHIVSSPFLLYFVGVLSSLSLLTYLVYLVLAPARMLPLSTRPRLLAIASLLICSCVAATCISIARVARASVDTAPSFSNEVATECTNYTPSTRLAWSEGAFVLVVQGVVGLGAARAEWQHRRHRDNRDQGTLRATAVVRLIGVACLLGVVRVSTFATEGAGAVWARRLALVLEYLLLAAASRLDTSTSRTRVADPELASTPSPPSDCSQVAFEPVYDTPSAPHSLPSSKTTPPGIARARARAQARTGGSIPTLTIDIARVRALEQAVEAHRRLSDPSIAPPLPLEPPAPNPDLAGAPPRRTPPLRRSTETVRSSQITVQELKEASGDDRASKGGTKGYGATMHHRRTGATASSQSLNLSLGAPRKGVSFHIVASSSSSSYRSTLSTSSSSSGRSSSDRSSFRSSIASQSSRHPNEPQSDTGRQKKSV